MKTNLLSLILFFSGGALMSQNEVPVDVNIHNVNEAAWRLEMLEVDSVNILELHKIKETSEYQLSKINIKNKGEFKWKKKLGENVTGLSIIKLQDHFFVFCRGANSQCFVQEFDHNTGKEIQNIALGKSFDSFSKSEDETKVVFYSIQSDDSKKECDNTGISYKIFDPSLKLIKEKKANFCTKYSNLYGRDEVKISNKGDVFYAWTKVDEKKIGVVYMPFVGESSSEFKSAVEGNKEFTKEKYRMRIEYKQYKTLIDRDGNFIIIGTFENFSKEKTAAINFYKYDIKVKKLITKSFLFTKENLLKYFPKDVSSHFKLFDFFNFVEVTNNDVTLAFSNQMVNMKAVGKQYILQYRQRDLYFLRFNFSGEVQMFNHCTVTAREATTLPYFVYSGAKTINVIAKENPAQFETSSWELTIGRLAGFKSFPVKIKYFDREKLRFIEEKFAYNPKTNFTFYGNFLETETKVVIGVIPENEESVRLVIVNK